jgi:carbon storage regulator CsrA
MLVLKIRIGESIKIGDVAITLMERDGNIIKIAVDADKSIPVRRVSASTQAQIAGKMGIGAVAVA